MFDKIQNELKQAQLDRDEVKVSTLRLLLSEIHNLEIQRGGKLNEQDIVSVVQRELKKRTEAAVAFKSGGREELAQKEEVEAEVLKAYLPAQLSDQDLGKIIDEAISTTAASGMADMGKVIGMVMSKVAGQADGGRVSRLVKERLLVKS